MAVGFHRQQDFALADEFDGRTTDGKRQITQPQGQRGELALGRFDRMHVAGMNAFDLAHPGQTTRMTQDFDRIHFAFDTENRTQLRLVAHPAIGRFSHLLDGLLKR